MTKLTLRPLTVEDATVMVNVLADPALYTFTGGEPPTLPELERRYRNHARGESPDGSERWVNQIVEVDGEPVGYVQATVPLAGGPVEIAWVIGRPWQGRGYARAAAQCLANNLRADGMTHLIAHIHPEHTASKRIAFAIGLAPTTTIVDGEVRWEEPRN